MSALSAVEEYRKLVTETYPPFHAVETQFVKEYADAAIAEMKAQNERLQKRESDLEYIAEKWCEHECVASDCDGCPLQRRATP